LQPPKVVVASFRSCAGFAALREARKKEKGRRHVSMATASESFGQPVDISVPFGLVPARRYFLRRY
jgi:hypothetical protein